MRANYKVVSRNGKVMGTAETIEEAEDIISSRLDIFEESKAHGPDSLKKAKYKVVYIPSGAVVSYF